MANNSKAADFVSALQKLLETLPESGELSSLPPAKLRDLRNRIEATIERLRFFLREIDPVRQPNVIFDPSDPKIIGELIAHTLLIQPLRQLTNIDRFYGSGVYAIYYKGDFPAYLPIKNTETPIYVGKADPQDLHARSIEEQGIGLSVRLKDHRKSIAAAKNLNVDDFACRFLVVKSAWQETAEDHLISRFKPIWNNEIGICYGFGKHGDAAKTRSNKRSPWDTIHPGRPWAWTEGNVPNELSSDQIVSRIVDHFKKHPPVKQLAEQASDKT